MLKDFRYKKLLTFFFFLSGFSGLVYEIIWSRQLLLIFGSTTNSVVAVTAAFMAGLALGSAVFGRLSAKKFNALKVYAFLEAATGLSAISTLATFSLINTVFGSFYTNLSSNLILLEGIKFLLTFIALLPATFSMGATLPTIVKYFNERDVNSIFDISRLYAFNTLGAVVGVLLSAFVFIELFGLSHSLMVGFAINIFIAISAFIISGNKSTKVIAKYSENNKALSKKTSVKINSENLFILVTYGVSGFISLSYEILWTRMLTPSTGTYVYSFASILAMFLLGIAIGSWLYEKGFSDIKKQYFLFALTQIGVGIVAFLSVIVNTKVITLRAAYVLPTILPGTIFMGVMFPIVVKMIKNKNGSEATGLVYSINTVGSILGSLSASFLIIPKIGTAKGILILSIVNLLIALIYFLKERTNGIKFKYLTFAFTVLLILLPLSYLKKSPLKLLDAKSQNDIDQLLQTGNYKVVFLEDEVNSVLGISQINGDSKYLILDGVSTTSIVPETSIMAHLPILLKDNPKDVLVIAFGMGTTFHSALTHKGVNVDAVELSPSVPKLMYLFQSTAHEDLANPRGKVIINDGRNYVRLTNKKYDVIICDPPPPVNASGTTVLYSKNFYQDSRKILKEGGIFASWIFGETGEDDLNMLFKSFYENFKYVRVLKSITVPGYLLLGSDKEIVWNSKELESKFIESGALDDLNKFTQESEFGNQQPISAQEIDNLLIRNDNYIRKSIENVNPVTDDHPNTEYFFIRRTLPAIKSFIKKTLNIKKGNNI